MQDFIRKINNSVQREARGAEYRKSTHKSPYEVLREIKEMKERRDVLVEEIRNAQDKVHYLPYEMDLAAGQVGDDWTDKEGNEWGERMEEADQNLHRLITELNELDRKLGYKTRL